MADQDGFGSVSALQTLETELQHQVGDALTQLMQRSEESFAQAIHRMEDIKTGATAIVDRLVHEVDSLKGVIAQAETVLQARLTALDAGAPHHVQRLDHSAELVATGLGQIDHVVEAAESSGARLQDGLHAESKELTTVVEEAVQRVYAAVEASQQHADQVASALDALAHDAQTHGDEVTQALQTLGEHLSQLVDATRDAMHQASESGLAEFQLSASATMSDLENAGSQAGDAITALLDKAGVLGGDFSDEIHDVVNFIHKVVELLDRIKPILDLAEQLS